MSLYCQSFRLKVFCLKGDIRWGTTHFYHNCRSLYAMDFKLVSFFQVVLPLLLRFFFYKKLIFLPCSSKSHPPFHKQDTHYSDSQNHEIFSIQLSSLPFSSLSYRVYIAPHSPKKFLEKRLFKQRFSLFFFLETKSNWFSTLKNILTTSKLLWNLQYSFLVKDSSHSSSKPNLQNPIS